MLTDFISKKTYTHKDLLKELLKPLFDQKKVDTIFKNSNIDINWQNDNKETFLHICSKAGCLESVKWLLNKNINTEIQNLENETAIYYALHSNNLPLVTLLIEFGTNVNHLNIHNRSLIQEAIISCNNNVVSYLISQSENLSNEDRYGNNLIFDAIANGRKEIIVLVASLEEVDINHINHKGNTILQQEVVLRNNELAIELMQLGADPTISDKNGKNFLFYAISKGYKNVQILEKAVELGCDINTRSSTNTTILIESINHFLNTPEDKQEERENHLLMVKELIVKGVEIEAIDDKNETAFFAATRSADIKLIDIFLNNNTISINHQNIQGDTVLSILILKGVANIKTIIKFLEHNANPNIKNKKGKNCIEILSDIILFFQNHKEIDSDIEEKLDINGEYLTVLAKIIEHSKVDFTQLNSQGKPLFFDSILYFNMNLFKIFRDSNIDINLRDKEDHNILFELMDYNYSHSSKKDKKQYLEMMQNLINIGADVNAKNHEGLTPLHKSISKECEYTVKLLLDAKSDTLALDNKGRSIIHNCIWKDTTRYFKLIHSYNPNIINIPDRFGLKPINYAAFMGKKDLIIQMLDAGALVNNPHKKDPKILQFFEKFHKNIINIEDGVKSEVDRRSLRLLANTMIKEFNIKE
ncbi:ankyrin repeat domain-containing protein [Poseidonibacter lekithochrous]|uniref:ankyrin repeat domain-containing protein n=1 Tax=Poseidonibacter TaxID=2321187 RepID=UPI001C08C26D|nr:MULTISPECIES: ankyrin repeat domain-containing protein [Poseidonibacter]MBU3013302.1 ankyrin repeat domain-containing protein [Poseidonibacter lekithochrous]MDO6826599.1 ankyrin repeat domain-containing protein [Poseidonibacter sp. 1_MG-2023]